MMNFFSSLDFEVRKLVSITIVVYPGESPVV